METARKNVTEISQFARARGRNGGAGRGPLDDCREIAVLRLGEALNESIELVAGQLLPMAEKAVGLEMYHLYMDAMELARDRADFPHLPRNGPNVRIAGQKKPAVGRPRMGESPKGGPDK